MEDNEIDRRKVVASEFMGKVTWFSLICEIMFSNLRKYKFNGLIVYKI